MYSLSSAEDACLNSHTLFLSRSLYLAILIRLLLSPPYLPLSLILPCSHKATLCFCLVSCFSIRGGVIMSHVSEDTVDNRLLLRTYPIRLTSYCSEALSKAICCFSHASWVELLTCCSTCFTDFPGCLTRVTLAIREQLQGWSRMEGSLLWAGCSLASPVLYAPPPFPLTPLLERKCSSVSFTVSTAIFNAQWNIYPQAETQEDVQSQHKLNGRDWDTREWKERRGEEVLGMRGLDRQHKKMLMNKSKTDNCVYVAVWFAVLSPFQMLNCKYYIVNS